MAFVCIGRIKCSNVLDRIKIDGWHAVRRFFYYCGRQQFVKLPKKIVPLVTVCALVPRGWWRQETRTTAVRLDIR
jgi:hypothetical protein